MKVNAQEESVELMDILGQRALFTNLRVDRSTVPEDQYRIESNEVTERIVMKEMMVTPLSWLMAPQEDLDRFCQAFEKVMEAYYRD